MGCSLFVAFVAPEHSHFGSILSKGWYFALSQVSRFGKLLQSVLVASARQATSDRSYLGPQTTGLW